MDYAALAAELKNDPAALGYAGKTRGQIAALLNTPANLLSPAKPWTRQNQYVTVRELIYWGAKTGVRARIESTANAAGTAQAIALAYRDMLGGQSPGLDTLDPAVVGLTAGASVPDDLLQPIIEDLRARGVTRIEPVVVAEETVEFRLPEELEAR